MLCAACETERLFSLVDLCSKWRMLQKSSLFYRYFKLHPKSEIGSPGRYQGLNVGVLLLRLDRMRKSKSYNNYLSTKAIGNLVGTYGFYNTFLGKFTVY